jgi:GcrA cell cycle regulator
MDASLSLKAKQFSKPSLLFTTDFVYDVFMSTIKNLARPVRHDDLKTSPRKPKTVSTLLPGDCRWPIGDPLHRDFHFCGERKVEGHPYCELHMRRCFQPSRSRAPQYYRPRAHP